MRRAPQAATSKTADAHALEVLRLEWGQLYRIGHGAVRGWWAQRTRPPATRRARQDHRTELADGPVQLAPLVWQIKVQRHLPPPPKTHRPKTS
jgi:hypothetical protein